MIKKYDLLILNFLVLLVSLIIASTRENVVFCKSREWYPALGEFMFFMLYIGIPLLGFVLRFYLVNCSWVWPAIIFCEIILAWPCGFLIASWAKLTDEIYIGIFMTAPIFMIPGIVVSLFVYYILRIFIAKNDKTKYISNIVLHLLNYTLALTFLVLYALGV